MVSEEASDSEGVFWHLTDEIRIAILRALWKSSDDHLSFTNSGSR